MKFFLPCFAAVVLAVAPASSAKEFTVAPGGDNLVKFTSSAPMETFDGTTDQIRGHIVVDPGAVGDSVTVMMVVDLASIDTGIGKRNTHMRENHLETDKYPAAVFSGAAVISPQAGALRPGETVEFEVEGSFELHGVTRRVRTTVAVTTSPDGNRLDFETRFDVHLADYEISRPKFLFLKLDEVQKVHVRAAAVAKP